MIDADEQEICVRNLRTALAVLRGVNFRAEAPEKVRPAYVIGYAMGAIEATLIRLGEKTT